MEILDRLLISLLLLLSSTCLAGQVIQVLVVLVVLIFLCNSIQGDLETRSSQQLNPSTSASPDMEKLARFNKIFSVLI